MADFGAENSRFLLLKLCEFAAGNFGGFAAIKGQQSAANLCRKIGAICCRFVQKNWTALCCQFEGEKAAWCCQIFEEKRVESAATEGGRKRPKEERKPRW
ncbi:Uncharacterized protein TCM_023529 [Theobroma cacao]|uniref:Uncharacterized protein n=1 Tax=Theobroma cacao TaxID=3641 RepID=A0A061EV46_THECC|nr:Uncharacterized protein TCM_023529 [Theobroma cacao]